MKPSIYAALVWRIALVAGLISVVVGCQKVDDEPEAAVSQTNSVQAIAVEVASAELRALKETVSVTGMLEAFKKSTVAAEVSGQILQRHVEVGDAVAQGHTLVSIDSTMLRQRLNESQANVAAQKVAVASARNELKRGKNLMAKAFISKDELENLEFAVQRTQAQLQAALAAQALSAESLRDSEVSAPFAGVVEAVHVQQGDYINPGNVVATLADFSRMRVRAGVTASQAQQFTVGGNVQLTVDDAPGVNISGTVRSIGRIADTSTGSYPLEIWLGGEELSNLRDGMVAQVSAQDQDQSELLLIPSVAVFKRDGAQQVFLLRETDNGRYRADLQRVKVGRRTNQFAQILSGLEQGDKVVVDGQFALRDQAAVTF